MFADTFVQPYSEFEKRFPNQTSFARHQSRVAVNLKKSGSVRAEHARQFLSTMILRNVAIRHGKYIDAQIEALEF